MSTGSRHPATPGPQLLDAAKNGDEQAFELLVDPHRGELHAHCYRMLGSVHDAEDCLQETMLRAWRGLGRFEGRSSLRSWLYTIATNTSLNAIERRPKRVLPPDHVAATDPAVGPGAPMVESTWIEPYPDEQLGLEDGFASPDARYEQREAVELAFIAALQHLPPNQRAVLIMREVLGFSAKETATALETTAASVNSALQRARATVEERLPDQTQQQTLRTLGDERIGEIVEAYMEAWEQQDIERVISMLAEDATFSMPPMSSWFSPRDQIAEWMRTSPLSGDFQWRSLRSRANGQEMLGFYSWDPDESSFIPFALNVLTFSGEQIADVTAFIARSSQDPDPEVQKSSPFQPADMRELASSFERFGLPGRLD